MVKPNKILRDSVIDTLPHEKKRIEQFAFPFTPDSEYVVDDSSFIPISEAIKQLKGNSVSTDEIETTYDFPNGVDNGMSIPVNRRTDCKDIAEISSNIIAQVENLSEKLEKTKKKSERMKQYQSELNMINSKSSVDSGNGSAE